MKSLFIFLLALSSVCYAQTYIERLIPAVGDRAGFVGYFPARFEAGKTYPVLFLLHGIGERGKGTPADLKKLADHGNYAAAEKYAEQYGFIIVEPQTDLNWDHGEVEETYQWLKDSLYTNVNWKKVYLSGQSLGGGGTYRYLGINPNADKLFAAAAPDGAGPNKFFLTRPEYMTNLINTKVPVWSFHNRGDSVAFPKNSTLAVRTEWMEKKGTAKMWFSIFDMNGHTFPAFNRGKGSTLSTGLSYVSGYLANPPLNLYDWFLANEIGKPAVSPAGVLIPPVSPPIPPKPHTLVGYNIYGDNLRIVPSFSDGDQPAIKGETGDEIKQVWLPVSALNKPTTTSKKSGKKQQVVK